MKQSINPKQQNAQNNGKYLLAMSKLFSVLLIAATFIFFSIYCVFLPRETISTNDNIQTMPEFSFSSFFNGEYTKKLSDYFTDSVYNRDYIRQFLYVDFVDLFGEEYVVTTSDGEDEIYLGDTQFSEPEESKNDDWFYQGGTDISIETPAESDTESKGGESSAPESQTPDTPSAPEISQKPQEEEPPEINAEGILLIGTRAMEIYYGDPNLNTLPFFAQMLNTFAENNPDINVYSMVIPKAAAFYLDKSKNYGHLAGRTLNDLKNLEDLLSPEVQSINVYDILNQHKDEEIYMRTDHHWSSLGAYYAAKQFATDLGLSFADLSTYTKNVRQNYLGTLYTYSGKHATLRDNPENFVTYEPTSSYKYYTYDQNFQNPKERDSVLHYVSDKSVSSWYLTFIGGDSYVAKIQSEKCKNGRKLLIVKDSYGNALVPYLVDSFEEIYVVDARKFQIHLDTFTQQQGITDVLFAECTYSAVGKSYILDLKGLIE